MSFSTTASASTVAVMPVLASVLTNLFVVHAYRQLKLGLYDDGFSTRGALPTTVQFAPPAVSAGASGQVDTVRNAEH